MIILCRINAAIFLLSLHRIEGEVVAGTNERGLGIDWLR